MLDAFQKDYNNIINNKNINIVLEIGPGTGILSSGLNILLNKPKIYFLAIDINPYACLITKSTFQKNNIHYFDIINSNLLDNISSILYNNIDILIFNPPYVCTPSSEVGTPDISASWAGGKNGREVLDKLLYQLPVFILNYLEYIIY